MCVIKNIVPHIQSIIIRSITKTQRSINKGDICSTVLLDENKFQVNIDVQQFNPDEIAVKATGKNQITVEGMHKEKLDVHGSISRHFIRKLQMPDGHDMQKVKSRLSSDGVLSIEAPRIGKNLEEKDIQVIQTGQPVQKKGYSKEV